MENKKYAVILKGFNREEVIDEKGKIINEEGLVFFDTDEESHEFFLREYGYKSSENGK